MKRLFEILYLLSDKRQVTAKELADHFEVSIRTIHRDIEELTMAGVPLYTKQGRNGGIVLLDKFIFDKGIISEEEQQEIITALESFKAVNPIEEVKTLNKLRAFFQVKQKEWITIDISDWSNKHQEIYRVVKEAIISNHVLSFNYYSRDGRLTARKVEPIQLWFKSSNWYLKSFCLMKEDFRLFKLSRMKDVAMCMEDFYPKEFPKEENELCISNQKEQVVPPKLVLHISEIMGYQVYDAFDLHEIEKQVDGSFIVTLYYSVDEWLYTMILAYGHHAVVVEPKFIREEVVKRMENALKNYKDELERSL